MTVPIGVWRNNGTSLIEKRVLAEKFYVKEAEYGVFRGGLGWQCRQCSVIYSTG